MDIIYGRASAITDIRPANTPLSILATATEWRRLRRRHFTMEPQAQRSADRPSRCVSLDAYPRMRTRCGGGTGAAPSKRVTRHSGRRRLSHRLSGLVSSGRSPW